MEPLKTSIALLYLLSLFLVATSLHAPPSSSSAQSGVDQNKHKVRDGVPPAVKHNQYCTFVLDDNLEDEDRVHVEATCWGTTSRFYNNTLRKSNLEQIDLIPGVSLFATDATLGFTALMVSEDAYVHVLRSTFSYLDLDLSTTVLVNSGTLVLEDVQFVRNQGLKCGGVYVTGNSRVMVRDTRFIECSGGAAGALYADGDSLVEVLTTGFEGNGATELAGSMVVHGAVVLIDQAAFGGAMPGYKSFNAFAESLAKGADANGDFGEPFSESVAGAIYITGKSEVGIVDSTFNWHSSQSGAIYVEGESVLRANRTTVAYNFALEGGALQASGAVVELFDCDFNQNLAKFGGGVYLTNGAVFNVSESRFVDNDATRGGAIYTNGCAQKQQPTIVEVDVKDTKFIGNLAKNEGGGVFAKCSAIHFNRNDFENSRSAENGGALYLTTCPLVDLQVVTFVGCSGESGGAIFAKDSDEVYIADSTFKRNSATKKTGGGIELQRIAKTTILDTSFVANTAETDGGGISLEKSSNASFAAATFDSNVAKSGGGLSVDGCDFVDFTETEWKHNNATNGSGGGVQIKDVIGVTSWGSKFKSNAGLENGGGLYATSVQTLTARFTSFFTNTAGKYGGGMFVNFTLPAPVVTDILAGEVHGYSEVDSSTEMYLKDCTFTENEAKSKGGGLYGLNGDSITATVLTCASNVAKTTGGGFYLRDMKNIKLEGAEIHENSAGRSGGGGLVYKAETFLLSGSHINSNEASEMAGGLFVYDSVDFRASHTGFELNTVTGGEGGGLYVYKTEKTYMNDTKFEENKAGGSGGGADFNGAARVEMQHSVFTRNEADDGSGGGIRVTGTAASFSALHCIFESNAAQLSGGGMSIDSVEETVDVSNSEFRGNVAKTESGGGVTVHVAEALIAKSAIFTECVSDQHGGGIFILDVGSADLSRCVIKQCKSLEGNGGGMYWNGGSRKTVDFLAKDCTLIGNTAEESGGALFLSEVNNVNLKNCIMQSNECHKGNGGVVSLEQCQSLQARNIVAKDNVGAVSGGVLSLVHTDDVDLSGTFDSNVALHRFGGVIYSDYFEDFLMSDSRLIKNKGGLSGGGMYMDNGKTILFHHVEFVLNTAKMFGGAVDIEAVRDVGCINSTVADNTAKFGGGMRLHGSAPKTMEVVFDGSSLTRNFAHKQGGALLVQTFVSDARNRQLLGEEADPDHDHDDTSLIHLIIHNSTVSNNRAAMGGAIFIDEGELEAEESVFEGNVAEETGGVFTCEDGVSVVLDKVLLLENAAHEGGGFKADCGCQVSGSGSNFTENTASTNKAGSYSAACEEDIALEDNYFSHNFKSKHWWYYLYIPLLSVTVFALLICGIICPLYTIKFLRKKFSKEVTHYGYTTIAPIDPDAEDFSELRKHLEDGNALEGSSSFSIEGVDAKPPPDQNPYLSDPDAPVSNKGSVNMSIDTDLMPVPSMAPPPGLPETVVKLNTWSMGAKSRRLDSTFSEYASFKSVESSTRSVTVGRSGIGSTFRSIFGGVKEEDEEAGDNGEDK